MTEADSITFLINKYAGGHGNPSFVKLYILHVISSVHVAKRINIQEYLFYFVSFPSGISVLSAFFRDSKMKQAQGHCVLFKISRLQRLH